MRNLSKKTAKLWSKKIIICTLSIMMLGIACAINIKTNLGADPITVFYEGLSKILRLDVGLTANILNGCLVFIIFLTYRKYINVGTIIYAFALGTFIQIGIETYNLMHIPNDFAWRLVISLIGCFIAFISLGGFMSINIGIDPWTAAAIIISKKANASFRAVKIILDILTLMLGILMGGTIGIITVFCAVVGGPIIQKSSEILDKVFAKMLKSKCED